jgi:RimJ/RimL family protein N-acetyltransferase
LQFEFQPVLTGQLIQLRPLKPDDIEALFQSASDPRVWEQHPENDRYERDVFETFFKGAIESKGAFAIIDRRSGRIIGSSRYCDFNPANREIEVGWTFLEREFWGGAYNRELKTLMLDHAFRFVDRVLFVVGETNLRSQKALGKIGARFLKVIEKPDRHGAIQKNFVFVISASEWQAHCAKQHKSLRA